uniref:Capsid protein n=1 Tax=Genomoviridae sp. TaxID=2202565 RepID=A0A858NG45_9VIRU|nr:MAG: capsid protein [Genomoviridae sp.]
MAYGSRSRRRTRRSFTRRRPVARRVRRGPYRKRTTRTRRMTSRRVLNLSSTKKQDNMIPYNTTSTGGNGAVGPYGLPYTQVGQFIWCATARDRIGSGDPNASSLRTSDVCYMRGLKEKILISTNTGLSWRWRRICFTVKNIVPPVGTPDSLEVSPNGWVRLIANQWATTYGIGMQGLVFRGASGLDWNDVFTAKTDNTRVSIMYDRTRIIKSGNGNGTMISPKLWHPMNKNLVYDNDESGDNETTSTKSTGGKPGMGDYYVMDFIAAGPGGTSATSDGITFSPEATLYWHEK